jgi:hypothetical protein
VKNDPKNTIFQKWMLCLFLIHFHFSSIFHPFFGYSISSSNRHFQTGLCMSLQFCTDFSRILQAHSTMFVHDIETHWEFETADYLDLHLPLNLEIFTEDVFMHEIYCPKISERDSRLCVFYYTKQTKVWNVLSDPSRSAGPSILKLPMHIQMICESLNSNF